MQRDERIKLGARARDKITGLTGIVYCISEWLNGCRRISIQVQELKDGKTIDGQTFDAEQLDFVDSGILGAEVKPHGGPSITPTRNDDPK